MTNIDIRTEGETMNRDMTVLVDLEQQKQMKDTLQMLSYMDASSCFCNPLLQLAISNAREGLKLVLDNCVELKESEPEPADDRLKSKKVWKFENGAGHLVDRDWDDEYTPVDKIQIAIDRNCMVKPIGLSKLNYPSSASAKDYRVELFDRESKEPVNLDTGSNLVGFITIHDEKKAEFMWLAPFIDEFRSKLDSLIDKLGVDEISADGKTVTVEQAMSHWVRVVKRCLE